MYATWVYLAFGAIIAALAFALGQLVPGSGVIVAAGGSLLWTAWCAARGRRAGHLPRR